MQNQIWPDAGEADARMDTVGKVEHLAVEHLAHLSDREAWMRMTDEIERDGAGLGDADAGDEVTSTALDRRSWTRERVAVSIETDLIAS